MLQQLKMDLEHHLTHSIRQKYLLLLVNLKLNTFIFAHHKEKLLQIHEVDYLVGKVVYKSLLL